MDGYIEIAVRVQRGVEAEFDGSGLRNSRHASYVCRRRSADGLFCRVGRRRCLSECAPSLFQFDSESRIAQPSSRELIEGDGHRTLVPAHRCDGSCGPGYLTRACACALGRLQKLRLLTCGDRPVTPPVSSTRAVARGGGAAVRVAEAT